MPIPLISGPFHTFRDLNPGQTYMEYEGSTITIPIRAQVKGGQWEEERLKLRAFMRLEVFPAYRNGLGTREFQFIIRDWELFGYSRLLNKVFMGDERGYLAKGADPRNGREQAVMTFCVAHHYEKSGDDDNAVLAPGTELKIDDISHHDHDGQGNIYWHVDDDAEQIGKFVVRFFRARAGKGPTDERNPELLANLCGKAAGLEPGESFTTGALEDGRPVVPSLGNAVLEPNLKLQTPVSFSWRLGKKPRAGASGRIHIVSPSKSFCVAERGPALGEPEDLADFPARITYAANYHIYVNDMRFVEDQAGVAIACGIDQIPPRDVLVAFEKPHAGTLLDRFIQFGPGCCKGMEEIFEWFYRWGKSMGEHWRKTRLDVQSGDPPPKAPALPSAVIKP